MSASRLSALALSVAFGVGLCMAQYPQPRVPLYSMGFPQAQAQPPAAGAGEQVAEPPWVARLEGKLDDLVRLLKDRGAVGEGPPPARAEAKAGPEDALVSAAGACATCHAPDVAKQDGGDFTFFQAADGGLDMIPPATENEWRTIRRQLPKMPPPNNKKGIPPLTGPQRAAMEKWLDDNRPKK